MTPTFCLELSITGRVAILAATRSYGEKWQPLPCLKQVGQKAASLGSGSRVILMSIKFV